MESICRSSESDSEAHVGPSSTSCWGNSSAGLTGSAVSPSPSTTWICTSQSSTTRSDLYCTSNILGRLMTFIQWNQWKTSLAGSFYRLHFHYLHRCFLSWLLVLSYYRQKLHLLDNSFHTALFSFPRKYHYYIFKSYLRPVKFFITL